MSARSIIRLAALLAAILGYQPASAISITGFSGSFTGTATGEFRNNADGTSTPFAEPVTGQFAVDTVIPEEDCCGPPQLEPGRFHYNGPVFTFSVQAFGYEIGSSTTMSDGPDSVTLLDDGTEQSFRVTGGGPYWYWTMEFVAPDGGLFQDFDPMTFDPTRIDMSRSFAAFSDNIRSYGALVEFDSLAFDGYPSQVPEPATLGLFGMGLCGMGLFMLVFTRKSAAGSPRHTGGQQRWRQLVCLQ